MQQNQSGEYLVQEHVYKSMKELVDFCTTRAIKVNFAGVILQKPVSKVDKWTMKHTDIEVLNKFGSCSHFGEIGEALDKRSSQRVTFRSYAGTRPESINEFLLEAEMLKLCNHINVIR